MYSIQTINNSKNLEKLKLNFRSNEILFKIIIKNLIKIIKLFYKLSKNLITDI